MVFWIAGYESDGFQSEEWVYSTAVGEFPTNAYGYIHFLNEDGGSNEPSK